MTNDDATVERIARQIIRNFRGDPDRLVQPGEPEVYSTPTCSVTAVSPEKAEPLWKFYIPVAVSLLAVVRDEIKASQPDQAAVVEALDTAEAAA